MTSISVEVAETDDLDYLRDEAFQDQFASTSVNNDSDEEKTRDLKHLVQSVSRINDTACREVALINAMRNCREEVKAAKLVYDRNLERLNALKEVYNHVAQLLAGYIPFEVRLNEKKKLHPNVHHQAKRLKRQSFDTTSVLEPNNGATTPLHCGSSEASIDNPVPVPDNPIIMPGYHTHGPNMTKEMVMHHREAFYQKLVNCSLAELDSYDPPAGSANLKSEKQLAEWIYIAQSWNTGADGMDSGAFRSKYKTWYSRMKPVTYNLGRRTGIHLRTLDPKDGETAKPVLCRHNKEGNKSIVYLHLGQLFDALFEIHTLELGHRGRDATKNLADERYANIPDGQVRHFLDTCPYCLSRRSSNSKSM